MYVSVGVSVCVSVCPVLYTCVFSLKLPIYVSLLMYVCLTSACVCQLLSRYGERVCLRILLRQCQSACLHVPLVRVSAFARVMDITHFSSHHSFSLRTCSSSAGVKSFLMLNVLRISSGVLPLIMLATVLHVRSSRGLMSR